jgi:hypothetical protein
MYYGMRRSAIISFTIHTLLILAVIIVLPVPKMNQASDDEVSIDFVGPSVPQTGQKPAKHAAPADIPVPHIAPKAPTPKVTKPIVAAPPPPPPPPVTSKQPAVIKPPKAAPPPPPPVPSQTPAPTPPPPKQPPQKTTSTAVQPPLPLPPIPQPPPPDQSPTHQPHIVKTPVPLSQSVLNTLQDLKTLDKQVTPPTSTYNPDAGGAPDAGGNPNATANSMLSGANKSAIGAHVKPCFDIDAGAQNVDTFSVKMMVQTDAMGVIRNAVVAPEDQEKMANPVFNAFANRAINAVLDYQCSDLSSILPPTMLGQDHTFLFNFSAQ